jgi:arylsulfatase A-like enzyme
LIVITSDHGEELGDHYPLELANHGHSLKDDQLRVPLIISHPGIDYPVKRVRQAARTIDILPTIADLLKVPLKKPVDGKSLTLFMLGADPRERVVFGGSVDYGPLRSFVRTPQFKYIEVTGENVTGEGDTELNPMPDRIQLYDLDVDPKEMNNIAESRPEVAARLGEMLRKHQEGTSERVHGNVLPSVLEERLRSLGYLQ